MEAAQQGLAAEFGVGTQPHTSRRRKARPKDDSSDDDSDIEQADDLAAGPVKGRQGDQGKKDDPGNKGCETGDVDLAQQMAKEGPSDSRWGDSVCQSLWA